MAGGAGMAFMPLSMVLIHSPQGLLTLVQLAKPDFPFGFVFCLNKKCAVLTLLWNRLNGDFSCTLASCIEDTVTIPK